MRRRFGSGKLSSAAQGEEDINPMDGLANLADVMLVLACGLMLALIINWNVDIGNATQDISQPLTEVPGTQESAEDIMSDESEFERVGEGILYRDPVSGKLYIAAVGEE